MLRRAISRSRHVEEDPPSSLHWVTTENKIQIDGIPFERSVALTVSYTLGRRFAARVRLGADVCLPFLRTICGANNDLGLEHLKSKMQQFSAGVAVVPAARTDALDQEDLLENEQGILSSVVLCWSSCSTNAGHYWSHCLHS